MPPKKVNIGVKPGVNPVSIDNWVSSREPETPSSPPVAPPSSSPTPPTPPTPPAAPPTPPETMKMKRLTLDIPEPLHQKIKRKAVDEGTTMVDMLRELLEKTYT